MGLILNFQEEKFFSKRDEKKTQHATKEPFFIIIFTKKQKTLKFWDNFF